MMKIVVEEDVSERIDSYLAQRLSISRSKIQKLIKNGRVSVNEKVVNTSYKVVFSDFVVVDAQLDFTTTIEAENLPLDIVYEDEYLMVVNKKSGMVTHPAPGHY